MKAMTPKQAAARVANNDEVNEPAIEKRDED